MSGLGTRFEVLSNRHFTNAKEFTNFNSSNSLNKPPGKYEHLASVWARTCNPRKDQAVSFRRSIDIPGPPSKALFQISPEFGQFSNPIKHYALEINGDKVAAGALSKISGSRTEVAFGAKKLKLFHDGLNTIEVKVKRNELPEHARRCNTSKKNRVATFFVLSGDFAADVGLVEQAPPPQYYRAQTPSRTAIVNLTLNNNGPSALVAGAGTFTANVSGASKVAYAGKSGDPLGNPQVVALGPPFDDCQLTGTRVDCQLGYFSAHDSGRLSLYVQNEFSNTDFDTRTVTINWGTRSGPVSDPRFDNNDRQASLVWCGDKSMDTPGCASAQ